METSEQPDSGNITELPDEVKRQLCLLNTSQYYLLFTIAGIFMRYKLIDIQREMLLCGTLCPEQFHKEDFPDTFKIQVVSSILFLYALFGFYQQSEEIRQQACEENQSTKMPDLDLFLSSLVILAALIRFFILLKNAPAEEAQQETPQEQTITEEELEVPL